MRPFWPRKGRAVGAGGDVGGEQLLEEEGRRGERRDLGLREEAQELVAEGVEAGGLEPDDARAAPRRTATGRRACAAPPARASSTRPAERKVRPQQSGRRRPSARRDAGGSPAAARTRSAAERFSRLEVAVEGVAEEHEVAAVARHRLGRRRAGPPRARASSTSASSGGREKRSAASAARAAPGMRSRRLRTPPSLDA